jgi:hypothetical protein
MKPIANVHKWIERGIAESENCRKSFKQTKIHAMNAGMAFSKAREALDGEFVAYLAKYEHVVSKTSVYRYMEFFETALAWAADQNPALKNKQDDWIKAAYDVVLQSPKPFIALMRQLGEMRKFGEYDSVKYATKKLGAGNTQIEFAFDDLLAPLDHLAHFGDDNYTFKYPEGRDETEVLDEAIAKTRTVLERLEWVKKHGRTIEA